MKNYLYALLLLVFASACGGGASTEVSATSDSTTESTEDKSKNPDYQKGLALVAKSDCLTCHEIDKPKIGPTYYDVAAKYEDTEENIDKLAKTIIAGGSGVWGSVPMTAHPTLSEEDAKQMVKYILLLK